MFAEYKVYNYDTLKYALTACDNKSRKKLYKI